MDQSFELASTTPITVQDLREADSRGVRNKLFNYYVQRDPTVAPAAVAAALADVPTLEEQVARIGDDWPRLFTLAHLFRATLRRPQATDVPGHGTVSEVGICDGTLGVQQNLLVEGTLLVAGDLSVGGQIVIGDCGIIVVTGSMHASAIAGSGQVCVGGDVRMMFAELDGSDYSFDVGNVIDGFLLIQNDHVVRAADLSLGLHAIYPRRDAASDVFRPELLRDGKPDWTAVARAAQAAKDVFLDSYRTPEPARGTLLELL